MLPSKWEPKIVVEPAVTELVFMAPTKEVYVVPIVVPSEAIDIMRGFIVGSEHEFIEEINGSK